MIDREEAPTREQIDEENFFLTNLWAKAHSKWRTRDSFYHRTYGVWPAEYEDRATFRPSTPTNVVDHAIDTQMSFDPRVSREPVGTGEQHKNDADEVEVTVKAILDDAALQEPVLPWEQAGRHMIHYGYSVEQLSLYQLGHRPHEPERENGEDEEAFKGRQLVYRADQKFWNPVRIMAPHPARVLMDPLQKQPLSAIHHYNMTARDLHKMSLSKKRSFITSDVFDMKGRKEWDIIELMAHWTPEWLTVKIGSSPEKRGEIIWQQPNTWGFVPFVHGFSGWGMEPVDLNDVDPSYLAKGILESIMDSVRAEAQNLSAQHTIVIESAYTPPWAINPERYAEALNSGEIYEGDGRLETGQLPTKDVPQWLFRSGEGIHLDIQRNFPSDVLGGMRQSGVSTVGQQALLSNAGNRKFMSPSTQLAQMATVTTQRMLRLVNTVSELSDGIGASGKYLTRKILHGSHYATVKFEAVDPAIELQRQQMALSMFQVGVIDLETMWKMARFENTQEIKDGLLRDAARKMPSVHAQLVAAAAAEEFGPEIAQTLEEGMLQEAGIEQPVPPGMAGGMGGGGGGGGGMAPPPANGAVPEPLRQPISDSVPRPQRIDLGR